MTKSTIWQNADSRYVAEECTHGVVLRHYPIATGALGDGVKVAEGSNVATLFSVYDAWKVSQLHATSLGQQSPVAVPSCTTHHL